MTEDAIKNEMRLFALESIVCQHLATVYQTMPREIFDAVRRQAIEGTKRRTFAGADAALSDLFSAELQIAIERLYGMMKNHLDKSQTRQQQ
jgi:hypothetical protein